jgi:crotonobetainyl-CoA:carnitine CoA-transferase CaiB-like acyl-CoA transferase
MPLEGLLVVTLEQAVAAPYCSSRLADAGARVIKIERDEGDFARNYDHVANGESAYFVWLNRGKESICLNIKNPDDVALLNRMLEQADVFIQNLAPGAAARAGFDSAVLRERNPRLITVDISGYGDSGPYREMKAYDLLVQCETGLASITGAPEQPGRVGVSVCDIACGMYAHAGVLQALFERERSGRGKGLAVSLFDALADWMTVPLLHQDYAGEAPARVGLNHPSIAPYGAYACMGGDQVVISIQNNREWRNLCEQVLQRPDLVEDPLYRNNVDRCANRPALDVQINGVFASLDRAELVDRLFEARIAFGSVNSVADLSRHQQLRRQTVATPSGPVELVAPPVILADGDSSLRPVPALGEHTDRLRKEFSAGNARRP